MNKLFQKLTVILLEPNYLFHSEFPLVITSLVCYLILPFIFSKLSPLNSIKCFQKYREQTQIHFSLAHCAFVDLDHNFLSSPILLNKHLSIHSLITNVFSWEDQLMTQCLNLPSCRMSLALLEAYPEVRIHILAVLFREGLECWQRSGQCMGQVRQL